MATSNNPGVKSPPKHVKLPQVIRRYLNGESLQTIAREVKRSRQIIYRWMLGGLGDEHYHEVVSAALVQRIADADKLLEDANEPVDIARAREMARFARMDFERRRPHLYGQQRQMLVTTNPSTPMLDGMSQLELARRVAWTLTAGAAAARAQQAVLPAPVTNDATPDLPTD